MGLVILGSIGIFLGISIPLIVLLISTPIQLMILHTQEKDNKEQLYKLKKIYLQLLIPFSISGLILHFNKPEFIEIFLNNVMNANWELILSSGTCLYLFIFTILVLPKMLSKQ